MKPYLTAKYGNASSLYGLGRESKKAISNARKQVASALNCNAADVVFTSGGTESDNMAIRGAAYMRKTQGYNHIITTSFEHPAILRTCEQLEREGFEVTYLPVNKQGYVDPKNLSNAIRRTTCLVSVMMINNELGTTQPVKELADIAHKYGAIFHTDAVQAAGHIPIDVKELGMDLLSLSAHKFHGPKGAGALICSGCCVQPLIYGGEQESGRRAGTENVAGIVGLGQAIYERDTSSVHVYNMKIDLMNKLKRIDGLSFNGNPEGEKTGILSVTIHRVEAEALLHMLDMGGICIGTGSACSSGSLKGSHVLRAIGMNTEEAHSTIRISIDNTNTYDEMEAIACEIGRMVEKLQCAETR